MRKMKWLLALLLVVIMVLGSLGCSSSKSPDADPSKADGSQASESKPEPKTDPSVVTIAASAEPEGMDPQIAGAAVGGNLSYNLYDYLVRVAADGRELIPCLATSWEQVDERTWRFTLREGVEFTNGEPFNADAVAYTLKRMFEPDTGRTTYNLKVVSEWKVVDEYKIDIISDKPCNDMPIRLYDLAILPPKYTEEVGPDKFGTDPIGCGPYKLGEWVTNSHIELLANENYWDGAPKTDRIVFRTIPEASTRLAELLAGNIDIVTDLSPDYIETVDSNEGYKATTALSKRVAYVGIDVLNEDSPKELADKRVRQALNYAIDRDTIIKNIYGGHALKLATIWRQDYVGYSDELSGGDAGYPYDPNKAKELLKEAGYENGFAVNLYYCPNTFLKCEEATLAIAGYLEDIGLTINLNKMEYNAYRAAFINGQEMHQGKGLFSWNWGAKPQTPDGHLAGALETGGITSYFTNKELDDLLAKLRAVDVDGRDAVAVDIQKFLFDECPYIYLWQQIDVYGINEKNIDWTPRLDQYILGTEINVK
ncbi:MAG TPA: hypothetical protein GX734_01030 [Clostridiaceae bacterium]|nr:hypothetical protein [Clostridiaceae bacterium]